MSFQKRIDKTIQKKEKQKEKEKKRIELLKEKLDAHKITRAEYNIKRKKIEEGIRHIDARIRMLLGLKTKDKKHQEELAEEKQKKKEEKEKKKKKKKKNKEPEEE